MRLGLAFLSIVLVILLVWVSGCATTSLGSAQVADFGSSTKDAQQAQDWFINKYGNPAVYSGPPRFLEPMVSDGIVNNTPTNKVSKFSQDTPSVYFWAFYEGFKPGDSVTAAWTYNGKNYAQLSKPVAGNYGIVFAQFDKPKSGWALGTHSITISGNSAQNSTTFEIINGPTVTAPLPYGAGSLAGKQVFDLKKIGPDADPALVAAAMKQVEEFEKIGPTVLVKSNTGSKTVISPKYKGTNVYGKESSEVSLPIADAGTFVVVSSSSGGVQIQWVSCLDPGALCAVGKTNGHNIGYTPLLAPSGAYGIATGDFLGSVVNLDMGYLATKIGTLIAGDADWWALRTMYIIADTQNIPADVKQGINEGKNKVFLRTHLTGTGYFSGFCQDYKSSIGQSDYYSGSPLLLTVYIVDIPSNGGTGGTEKAISGITPLPGAKAKFDEGTNMLTVDITDYIKGRIGGQVPTDKLFFRNPMACAWPSAGDGQVAGIISYYDTPSIVVVPATVQL